MKNYQRIFTAIAFCLFLTAAVLAQVIVPVNGPPLAVTPVVINTTGGDQWDPHISGDWVTYSEG